MKRGEVETTVVEIAVFAEVQDNGDGTWTACLPTVSCTPHTAGTRFAALTKAIKANSVGTIHD